MARSYKGSWSEDDTRRVIVFLSKTQKLLDQLRVYTAKPYLYPGSASFYREITRDLHNLIQAFAKVDRQAAKKYCFKIWLNTTFVYLYFRIDWPENDELDI